MSWWRGFPDAWREATTGAEPPEIVMNDFVKWCEQFSDPIFVSHPLSYDFNMVAWYLLQYYGRNIFQTPAMMNALDLPSYVSGKFGLELSRSYRNQLPDELKQGLPEHSHSALDDAQGLAVLLKNIFTQPACM